MNIRRDRSVAMRARALLIERLFRGVTGGHQCALAEQPVCRRLHATTTTMSVAQLPAPDAAAPLENPGRVFIKREEAGQPSAGNFSDGGGSLSRRSRVLRRSSRCDDDDSSSGIFSTSGDISSGQLFVKIPSVDGPYPKSSPSAEVGVDAIYCYCLSHAC